MRKLKVRSQKYEIGMLVALATVGLMLATTFSGCLGGEKQTGPGAPPPEKKGGVIYGQVVDKDTLKGIMNASVNVGPIQGEMVYSGITDEEGRYRIEEISPRTYVVWVNVSGYYTEVKEGIEVREGEETEINFALTSTAVQPSVPTQIEKTYVDEDDRIIFAAVLEHGVEPCGTTTVLTEKTVDKYCYGYWKLPPQEGYQFMRFKVNISWQTGTVSDNLGLRFFRGESTSQNEGKYYIVEPLWTGDHQKYFEIECKDMQTRTWQIGVYPMDLPGTGGIGPETNMPYHIKIDAVLAPVQPSQ